MDLLSQAEKSDFCNSVSYFHPESYALFDDGEFLYDVSQVSSLKLKSVDLNV